MDAAAFEFDKSLPAAAARVRPCQLGRALGDDLLHAQELELKCDRAEIHSRILHAQVDAIEFEATSDFN